MQHTHVGAYISKEGTWYLVICHQQPKGTHQYWLFHWLFHWQFHWSLIIPLTIPFRGGLYKQGWNMVSGHLSLAAEGYTSVFRSLIPPMIIPEIIDNSIDHSIYSWSFHWWFHCSLIIPLTIPFQGGPYKQGRNRLSGHLSLAAEGYISISRSSIC